MLQMILIMAIIHHFFCKWYRVDLIFLFRPHHEGGWGQNTGHRPEWCLSNVPVADMDNIRVRFFAPTGFGMLFWGIQWQCQPFLFIANFWIDTWWRKWFSAGWRWMAGWVYHCIKWCRSLIMRSLPCQHTRASRPGLVINNVSIYNCGETHYGITWGGHCK